MPLHPPTVLVVEDEALLLFSIADDLREQGFEVLEASNADEAIRLLNANAAISVVFTDIDMPGSIDGLRLSAVIQDRWPPVRVLLTSGKQAPDPSRLPAGGKFLPKPYSPASVAAEIRGMLG